MKKIKIDLNTNTVHEALGISNERKDHIISAASSLAHASNDTHTMLEDLLSLAETSEEQIYLSFLAGGYQTKRLFQGQTSQFRQ